MKQSLYRDWMVRLQMFLAAPERRPEPSPGRQRQTQAPSAA
jgi:hypothetical protein